MRCKNLFVLILFLGFYQVGTSRECSCGSYETATIEFSVKDDPNTGCCSGEAIGTGYYLTWTIGEGRTWELDTIEEINATAAQKSCCEST